MAEPSAIAAKAARVPAAMVATPTVADVAVARAEQIAFLAMASELARERDVLVVDDGASALSGIAAHLDSTALAGLAEIQRNDYDLVVADLDGAPEELSAAVSHLASVVNTQAGIALVRIPNRPQMAGLGDRIIQGFARSVTLRQHNWVSSGLFDDAMFENGDPSRAAVAAVRKLAAAGLGEQLYDVLVLSHGELPRLRAQLALTRSPELTQALAELQQERMRAEHERAEFTQHLAEREARVIELEAELAWYDENKLAIRPWVESNSLASMLLSFWVFLRTNLGKLRRALGS